jgi:soluble lytic murein transglycosylase-like protein
MYEDAPGAEPAGMGPGRAASVPLPPERPVLMAMLAPAEAVVAAVPVVPTPVALGAESIRALIARHAAANGVPAYLADAIVRHESRYNPRARNGANIGLMQISLPTARALGYDGSAAGLADAETNLAYGVRYLAQAWRLAGGDTCRTVLKYQGGHRAVTMTPAARAYCASLGQQAFRQAPEKSATQNSGPRAGDED